jgi:hypothetical protein
MSLVIRRNIYFVIYNLGAKSETHSIYKMQQKMEKLSDLRPQHLDISEILSLDANTREHVIGNE